MCMCVWDVLHPGNLLQLAPVSGAPIAPGSSHQLEMPALARTNLDCKLSQSLLPQDLQAVQHLVGLPSCGGH